MTDGILILTDGRPTLRFERRLPHHIERVWRAVSEPAELERWFPAAADWTPAVGQTFEAAGMAGEVTAVDPPRRLEWTFVGGFLSEADAHADWAAIHERYAASFGVDPAPGRAFAATLRDG